MRESNRHHGGTDSGRGAQQTQSPGSGVENFASVDRQQSDRPSEQHREKIERDRAQNELLTPDVMQSCERGLQRHGLPRRALFRLDAEGGDQSADGGERCRRVHDRRTAESGVKNAAERWPENSCGLKRGCVPGDGVGEMFFRNELRKYRSAGRAVERAHDAEQDQHT
jgi:hypothetical protein